MFQLSVTMKQTSPKQSGLQKQPIIISHGSVGWFGLTGGSSAPCVDGQTGVDGQTAHSEVHPGGSAAGTFVMASRLAGLSPCGLSVAQLLSIVAAGFEQGESSSCQSS